MPYSDDSLEKRRNTLEDRFFMEQDRLLLEKLREIKRIEEARRAISEISGVTAQRNLDRMMELGITPETAAMLALVPLIEVAWADGRMDVKERKAILDLVSEGGLTRGSPNYELLDHWLARKPAPELLEAWTHYVEGLCEQMTADERDRFEQWVVDRTRTIAESVGGFLGLTSPISEAERQMIQKLRAAIRR
jgi:tellurite resistance protein